MRAMLNAFKIDARATKCESWRDDNTFCGSTARRYARSMTSLRRKSSASCAWRGLSMRIVLSDYAKGVLTPEVITGAVAAAGDWKIPVIVDPKSPDFRRYQWRHHYHTQPHGVGGRLGTEAWCRHREGSD